MNNSRGFNIYDIDFREQVEKADAANKVMYRIERIGNTLFAPTDKGGFSFGCLCNENDDDEGGTFVNV